MGDLPANKKTDAFTYEQLFEILRLEKNSPNLQKLSKDFPHQVDQYVTEKEREATKAFNDTNVFAQEQAEQLQQQLRNARRITRMIYDLREKKITQLALNKSRTSSSLIDTSNLLEHEIELFKELLDVLDKHRHVQLLPLLAPKVSVHVKHTQSTQQETQQKRSTILVRILEEVPVLVGPDLKEYGPFVPEDIANIPVEIGSALVQSNKAQELKPQL